MRLNKSNLKIGISITLAVLTVLLSAQMAEAGCGSFCRGQSLDQCRSFWVWESGLLYRFGESELDFGDDWLVFNLELGHMRNITTKSAVGGTLFFSYDSGEMLGFKGRYRQWLNRKVSLDFSPGVIVWANPERSRFLAPGFVGSVTLGWGDWGGLTLQYSAIRYEFTHYFYPSYSYRGTEKNVYLGVRTGSYAAVALPVVVLATVLLTTDDVWGWERD